MSRFNESVIAWFPLAIAVSGLCLFVLVAAQQIYRQSLNDPQIQIAEDAARLIGSGVAPKMLVPSGAAIDIDASLAPWIVIYDAAGVSLASTALLHNVVPSMPDGVLAYARAHGENRVTWQPEPGVRQAIVVVKAGKYGFVVAGRNMREVERRESGLVVMTMTAWAVVLAATLGASLFIRI